jgi:hypothetical protein
VLFWALLRSRIKLTHKPSSWLVYITSPNDFIIFATVFIKTTPHALCDDLLEDLEEISVTDVVVVDKIHEEESVVDLLDNRPRGSVLLTVFVCARLNTAGR